jgi:hypothetical protein
MTSKRSRPLGIAVIGWINIVGGVVIALAGFAPQAAPAGPVLVFAGILSVALAVALLRLQRWARVTFIALYVLNSAVGLAEMNPIAVVVSALLIAYLLSPKVKDAFAGVTADHTEAPVSSTHECLVQS